jgi:hypothetical protein
LVLQFRLGHWYPFHAIANLEKGTWTVDPTYQSWTYANNLGLSIIEYAEFEVGDQTVERITGEFIQTFLSTYSDVNMLYGYATDGAGRGTLADLATNSHGFDKNRPWPTQNGNYFTVLPFFFFRNRLKEIFPLLSCTEGTVRVNVKLRSFQEMVRSSRGFRESCDETPLNQTATFIDNNQELQTLHSGDIEERTYRIRLKIVADNDVSVGAVNLGGNPIEWTDSGWNNTIPLYVDIIPT